jgi:NADPH:quinone reductase-like Zn-dependent oxidoreductase
MFAVAVKRPDELAIVQIPEPEPGPYEALIRTEIASICNMTDRKVIEGHFPGLDEYPLLLGHETVGTVEAVGEKVQNFQIGDRVVGGLLLNTTSAEYASGWGGFSEYIIAGDHFAMVKDGVANDENGWYAVYEIMTIVPRSISLEDAVMLCSWREVYSAIVDDFRLKAGDDILVFGDGPVSLSFVKFARLLDFDNIYLVGKYPEKMQKALDMGAKATYTPDDPALQELVRTRNKPFDAVIDGVGKEEIINTALRMIKMGGSICVYGVLDTPAIHLKQGEGPHNFNLLMHQWPTRASERAAQEPLVAWIQAGKLSYREFVSGEFPVQQIQDAYDFSKKKHTVKTLLRY